MCIYSLGRDLISVVRIREVPYYGGLFLKRNYDNFFGTLETVRIREVSVPRGSTVVIIIIIKMTTIIIITIINGSAIIICNHSNYVYFTSLYIIFLTRFHFRSSC